MKKCPYCAEEIQDEAIKCKHCGERLDKKPPAPEPTAADRLAGGGSPGTTSAPPAPAGVVPGAAADAVRQSAAARDAELLYQGSPSWRAYFGWYALTCLITPVAAALSLGLTHHFHSSTLWQALSLLIPIALGVIVFVTITFIRSSVKVRVSDKRIESEVGMVSKRIDILELWRVRDLQFRQSFLDRVLGISHIVVFCHDESTREETRKGAQALSEHLGRMELTGLPEGRRLFEKLRDCVAIQRQSNRVIGMTD